MLNRFYQELFSNKALFRQLLELFVPLEWAKELDFNHDELLDKTFIFKNMRNGKVMLSTKFNCVVKPRTL